MKNFITTNAKQTQQLGGLLVQEILADKKFDLSRPKRPKEVKLREAFIICLSGDLGSGKTTFTQGLLKGLKVKGPYTSPTFVVMKHYKSKFPISNFQFPNKSEKLKSEIQNIYHIDAYRVKAKDILNLGWEEIVANKKNVIIVEWADRIKKIIPKEGLWIKFEWLDKEKRKIIFNN